MDADGFVDLGHVFSVQLAEESDKATFINGSDLVRLDFGVFRKIRRTFAKKYLKWLNFICIF